MFDCSVCRRVALSVVLAGLAAPVSHAVPLVGTELGVPTNGDAGETVVDTLVNVDESTSAASSIGSVGFKDVRSLAYDANSDTLYGIDIITNSLLTIDPSTGAGTAVGTSALANFVIGLAYDPNSDTLYGADNSADQLVTFNTATAGGTAIGSFNLGSAGDYVVQGLAYDPDNDVLYGVETFQSGGDLITIDTSTGQGTVVGSIGAPVFGLAYDAATQTLYGTNSAGFNSGDQLYTIDTTTGVGTAVGPLGSSFSNVQGLAYVPEPATLSVLTALGVVIGSRRRAGRFVS